MHGPPSSAANPCLSKREREKVLLDPKGPPLHVKLVNSAILCYECGGYLKDSWICPCDPCDVEGRQGHVVRLIMERGQNDRDPVREAMGDSLGDNRDKRFQRIQ